jgi:hypothetical protein
MPPAHAEGSRALSPRQVVYERLELAREMLELVLEQGAEVLQPDMLTGIRQAYALLARVLPRPRRKTGRKQRGPT